MPNEKAIAPEYPDQSRLYADCIACCNLHERYVGHCHLLEQIESALHDEGELERARERVIVSRQAWMLAAESVMKTQAQTFQGLRAKASVLRGLLRETSDENLQGVSAALGFIDEVERVLGDSR